MQQSLICQITKENTVSFLTHFKKTLKSYFSSPVHNLWISSLAVKTHTPQCLTFEVNTQQLQNAITRNHEKFSQVFVREYQAFFNEICQFEITVSENQQLESSKTLVEVFEKTESHLEPKFTFQNFITSSQNILAYTTIQGTAQKIISGSNGNFICITGTIGNGKTHILQSIGNEIEKSHSVQYMTSERFMFLYTKSVANKNLISFRETISKAKLLLIDDIHFILQKDGTMRELASTIRHVLSCGGNVAITSAVSLNAIKGISSEIQSTFSKSVNINIENPSKELRYKILEYKNKAFGYNLSNEVMQMLAEKITSNIRDLETTFERINIHGTILNSEIDINAANIILKEIFPSTPLKTISIKTILEEICTFFNVTKEEILSQSRLKEIVTARQAGMHLAIEMTNETAKKIGFEFGGRTHSTVIHSCKAVKKECETSPKKAKEIETLKYQILSK